MVAEPMFVAKMLGQAWRVVGHASRSQRPLWIASPGRRRSFAIIIADFFHRQCISADRRGGIAAVTDRGGEQLHIVATGLAVGCLSSHR
jgi:hypothetical protein